LELAKLSRSEILAKHQKFVCLQGLSIAIWVATQLAKKVPDMSDTGVSSIDQVTALVYELLDAHRDTSDLADSWTDDPRWAAHLDYLRDLQRVGREALAALETLQPLARLERARPRRSHDPRSRTEDPAVP
jgi:hypothetical protein